MRTIALALLLAGCAHHTPQVPQSKLSSVPPAVIDQTKVLQKRDAELQRQIAEARVNLHDADEQIRDQEFRLKSIRSASASDLDLKQSAVQSGDVATARSVDQRESERNARSAQVSDNLTAAKARRDRAAANLELLESDRDLVDSQIQLARAQGIASTTHFDTTKYQTAVKAAQKRRDEAAQKLQALPPEPSAPPGSAAPPEVPPPGPPH